MAGLVVVNGKKLLIWIGLVGGDLVNGCWFGDW